MRAPPPGMAVVLLLIVTLAAWSFNSRKVEGSNSEVGVYTNSYTNFVFGEGYNVTERFLWEDTNSGVLYVSTETTTNVATCKDLEEAVKTVLKYSRRFQ